MTPAGNELAEQYRKQLSDEATKATTGALAAYDSGEDEEAVISAMTGIVLGSAARQAAGSEVFLRDLLTVELNVMRPTWGFDEVPDEVRIMAALGVALTRNDHSARSTLRRIVHHESTTAGRAALTRAMAATPEVVGWTRLTDNDPCKLCASLVGPTLGPDVRMISHPGCACVAQPVLTERR